MFLLEKGAGAEPLKEFPAFYAASKLIIVLARAHEYSLS
jgi:hypothetical protein